MPHPPQIPLTPQTDERNFPRWQDRPKDPHASGYAYPKMLMRVCTPDDRKAWQEKYRRVDQSTGKEYWDEQAPPRVGSMIPRGATQEMVDKNMATSIGQPLVVSDEHEENEVLKMLGIGLPEEPAKTVAIPIARPKLVEPPEPKPAKRRGRPPKARIVESDPNWVEEK